MSTNLVVSVVLGVWFIGAIFSLRTGVMIYKLMYNLPLDYTGTRQIPLGSWGGISFYASVWPLRKLRDIVMLLWAVGPAILLRVIYAFLVRYTIGEAQPPQEIIEARERLERLSKIKTDMTNALQQKEPDEDT